MEDKNIIKLFLLRSNEALIQCGKKYGAYLYTVSWNILGSKEDAEECVNDSYLKTWQTIPPNEPKSLKFYLVRIVRNLSIDKYRMNKAQARGQGNIAQCLEELSQVISSPSNIDEKIDEKYVLELINAFLQKRKKEERKIFLLRYFYAYSIKEIGEKIGMKENTLYTKLHRMRLQLKEELEKGGVYL